MLARFVGSSGGADPVLGRRPAWLEHADGKLRWEGGRRVSKPAGVVLGSPGTVCLGVGGSGDSTCRSFVPGGVSHGLGFSRALYEVSEPLPRCLPQVFPDAPSVP